MQVDAKGKLNCVSIPKIRGILRPGKAQAETRDRDAKIRNVLGHTRRLAT